jgi:hypothetical protein
MTIITAPFHFIAPQAPEEVQIERLATDGDRRQKGEKILELNSKVEAPKEGKVASADSKPIPALAKTEDNALEFFETDRADAGVMFTKKDLEVFQADLKS